jgi:hypothetical protein
MPIISAFRRLREEDCEFEASLGYIERSYLKSPKERECKPPTMHQLAYHLSSLGLSFLICKLG